MDSTDKSHLKYFEKLLAEKDLFSTYEKQDGSKVLISDYSDDDILPKRNILYRAAHLSNDNSHNVKLIDKCEGIIFQSEFMKKEYEKQFKLKNHTVIHNGCQELQQTTGKNGILMYGYFNTPEKVKSLLQTIEWLDKYEISICGDVPDIIYKNVKVYDESYLPELRSTHSIYVHSTLNDNCPNSLLEAINGGLLVCGYNSGSIPELTNNVAEISKESLLSTIKNLTVDKKPKTIKEYGEQLEYFSLHTPRIK